MVQRYKCCIWTLIRRRIVDKFRNSTCPVTPSPLPAVVNFPVDFEVSRLQTEDLAAFSQFFKAISCSWKFAHQESGIVTIIINLTLMINLVLYKRSFLLKIPFTPGFISALQGVIYPTYRWQNPVVVVHLGRGLDNKSPLQAMLKLDFYKGMGAMPTLQIQLLGDFLLAYDTHL